MAWTLKTLSHPTLYNRDITIIFKDGLAHLASSYFFQSYIIYFSFS